VGGWTVQNIGNATAVAPFSHGYYLSADSIITTGDLLLGTESTVASLAPDASQSFGARTLTIPVNTPPGNYFIGLLADRTNAVAEGRENNNAARVALTVTAAVSNATLVVTNVNDTGAGSLRAAITAANAAAGLDTITFAIPATNTPTIAVGAGGLPALTGPVVIDGTTQGSLVVLNGAGAGAGTNGLTISGGSSTIRGLVIQSFGGNGIQITGAGGNLIEGNLIGTNSAGSAASANAGNGVLIVDVPNNTIGGAAAASRNVISGNGGEGVRIDGANATGNIIIGNYIGASASGTVDVGNAASGVYIRRAPGNSVIGNVVSGNNGFAGVAICGNTGFCGGGNLGDQTSTAQGNIVQGNFIGTAANGTSFMGNNGYGVSLDGTPDVVVGGQAVSARNVIAYSGNAGVVVFGPGSAGNTIVRNSIHSNTGLGIDLGTAGGGDGIVTLNDPGDTDNGPNRLQNFPVLSSAINSGGVTTLVWSLNTTANTQVVVDFFSSQSCDATGYGQGQTYLASVTQTTSPSGNLSFSTTLNGLSDGMILTAVATSAAGGTSEFSGCRMVTPPGLVYWPVSEGGNGHVYEYVLQGGLSWTAARTAAEARNFNGWSSHLVSITSAAENTFVEALRNGGPLRAWIGLYDPDGTGPGSWAWTTGETTVYFNWAPGEPNNPTTEFWVEMFGGGQWNNNVVQDPVFPTLGYLVEYEFVIG
jgi:lectin-like protein/CARDB protein